MIVANSKPYNMNSNRPTESASLPQRIKAQQYVSEPTKPIIPTNYRESLPNITQDKKYISKSIQPAGLIEIPAFQDI